MSFAKITTSNESKESFRSQMEAFNKKLMKFPKKIHHGLHKGADKTSHKVADGTKEVLKHDQ